MNDATTLIGAREAAELLSLSPASVYRLARTGQIPAYRYGGTWRFDADELLAKGRTTAGQVASARPGQDWRAALRRAVA